MGSAMARTWRASSRAIVHTHRTALYQTPFRGVAPQASLISLRVIGADGTGLTSDVIGAIQWAVRHRHQYNIRVINLSLGHAVEESYQDDPLCEAVERAVQAGIVVVAAAGNRGKNSAGESVYGTIESPANDPYAIAVGALNTHGTVQRSDDELASYSAKGPTAIDGLLKPDLAAPGNKIVSAEAAGSALAVQYADLHASGLGADAYMTLSGTSMASAVASGAAALVVDVNPKLTPAQVKIALQYSATFLPAVGFVGAGAGSLNVAAAVQVAKNGPTAEGVTSAETMSRLAFLAPDSNPRLVHRKGGWGALAANGWFTDDTIVWGNFGDTIVWGNFDDTIVWGNSWFDDTIVWGNSWFDDTIVWGNHTRATSALSGVEPK